MIPGDPAGVAHLYVHLPFCAARCGYCAFVVEVGREDARDAYLQAVRAEIRRADHLRGPLESVYLGGGTPTLMGAGRLQVLLDEIHPRCAPGAEVTVEANPETVDAAMVAALADAGATRVSLGAQSTRDHLLAALDRRCGPDQVRRAVDAVRADGRLRLSVDLMLGVPGQDGGDLAADLEWVLAVRPEHVSWYELEFKEGSAIARGGAVPPDEDRAADLYEQAIAGLEGAGYRWYELANFALPGAECRHSLAYWRARDYVGVGVGAVSTVGARRWRNAPGLDRYIAALGAGEDPPRSVEQRDADVRRRERWMLGTRLDEPLDMAWAGPADHPDALARLAERGLLQRHAGTVQLTRRGRLLQNAVVQEILDFA